MTTTAEQQIENFPTLTGEAAGEGSAAAEALTPPAAAKPAAGQTWKVSGGAEKTIQAVKGDEVQFTDGTVRNRSFLVELVLTKSITALFRQIERHIGTTAALEEIFDQGVAEGIRRAKGGVA